MATIAQSVNDLDLWFRVDDHSKLFKLRIIDPAPNLSRETIQSAAQDIINSKVISWDSDNPNALVKAAYYHRDKKTVAR